MMKKTIKNLFEVKKQYLVLVVVSCTGLILMSFGGGPKYVPTFKDVFLNINYDFSSSTSWRSESSNSTLVQRIPTVKEWNSSEYWGTTSMPDIEKIVTKSYYLLNKYYAKGEAFKTKICIDDTNLSGVNGGVNSNDMNKRSVVYKGVETSGSGSVSFQIMSQCEEGKGIWWKYEKSHFPGDWPLTINDSNAKANLKFQYVTSCISNNGRLYGCDSNDNQ